MRRYTAPFIVIVIVVVSLVSTVHLAGQPVLDQPPVAALAAVGDLNFAGGLGERIIAHGPDYPWAGTAEVLAGTDLRLGNLETPLSLKGQVYVEKEWTLHADPRTVESLVRGGFNVVTMANNHAMDFGPLAMQETISLLDAKGVGHCGAGANLAVARAPVIITANGIKFAFLGYSLTYPTEFYAGKSRYGTAPGYEEYLRADIPAAKAQADIVVVSFHWSAELLNIPKDYQRHLGRLCIDLGAGLVVGHHPHVLQGFEVYHHGLIAYSLGNFAFGSYSKQSRDSAILTVRFERSGPKTAWIYPVNVNNYEVAFQTRLRKGPDADRVLADLRHYSAPFGTEIMADGDRGVIDVGR